MTTPPQVPYYRMRRQRSVFGPIILIAIGVLLLLYNFGLFTKDAFGVWFAKYWPVLLILLGLIKLGEYVWARQSGNPPPRLGGGSIVFLVFLILAGMSATGISRHWNDWNINLGDDADLDSAIGGIFGSKYDFSDNFSQPVNATEVRIISNHGNVKITASTDNQIHAILQKSIRTDSQENANHFNESTHPQFAQQGSVAVLDLTGGNYQHGEFDLDLQVPRAVSVAVATHTGDITVSERDGNVDLSTDRGDVDFDQIKGNASIHLHHGSATGKDVSGNIVLDGNVTNTNFSEVKGTVTMTGTYWGDMQLSHLEKPFHLTTSRTDLQFSRLDGNFTMEPDELQANAINGPFRLETRSKGVHLDDVSGEVHIQNRNATVELRPKTPLSAIDVSNVHGDVRLEVPQNAGFQLDAQSLGGEINTDFDVKVDNARHDATARGAVGKGGPAVTLRAERGTIEVRKQ